MAKLPQITAKELIKILAKLGFEIKKTLCFLFGFLETEISDNYNKKFLYYKAIWKPYRGLLNKILKKDVQISREEFEKLF